MSRTAIVGSPGHTVGGNTYQGANVQKQLWVSAFDQSPGTGLSVTPIPPR